MDELTPHEREILLKLARRALELGVRGQPLPPLAPEVLTDTLRAPGASFVTLTKGGQLRGCIGTLMAYRPLVEDVRQHAIAAALDDYRFPPVSEVELPEIQIEISRLTPPRPLDYQTPEQLLAQLRPGVDGVVLRSGLRRATFLPQVWEKLSRPEDFLSQLCLKMGAPPDLWRREPLQVEIYQVEEFHE